MPNRSSSTKPSTHVCPDCGRAYKAAETLNRHRKNHSEAVQYVCTICSASFKRKDLLDRHSQIHAGGRPTAIRNRSQRACDRCSRLKTRCDNANPCTRCSKGGHECSYQHLRSRARTDRSSIYSSAASSHSSVHSSPHMITAMLDASAGAPSSSPRPLFSPEPHVTTSVNPKWTADSTWAEQLWMLNTVWRSPGRSDVDPSLQFAGNDPKLPHTIQQELPPDAYPYAPVALDPTLESGTIGVQCTPPNSIASLYNPAVNMSWSQKDAVQICALPIDSACGDYPDPLTHSDGDYRRASLEILHLRDLLAYQQRVIHDLAVFSTSEFSVATKQEAERALYWRRSAQSIERAFRLDGLAPLGTHVLHHFYNLFLRYFPTDWTQKQASSEAWFPPHLYLTMAAIGAAYAGTRAEAFHKQMLEALQPTIMQAAVEKVLSDEATLLLVQSLVLLQTALLDFGDRNALETVRQMATVTVSLSRRIQLFSDANFPQTQSFVASGTNTRHSDAIRRLAAELTRLDMQIARLCGTACLLTERESKADNSTETIGVLGRLLQRNGAAAVSSGMC